MSTPTPPPQHAIAAVVHADPYPYYAMLRKERPFYFDEALSLWVGSSGTVIEEALASPLLRVRPPEEPVPRALVGMPAGDVFAMLVRMNDGEFHATHRPQVVAAATRMTMDDVAHAGEAAARDLASNSGFDANALLTKIPVQAMARMLGVRNEALDATVQWVEDFVAGIATGAAPETIARANLAALQLMAQGAARGLDKVQSANRIAMMQQSLDATAGLIGNAIRFIELHAEYVPTTSALDAWRIFVAEVARFDSPVQNTRRFAAAPVQFGGHTVQPGQGVLLVLASGNRDAAFNPEPDTFDVTRTHRRMFSFGDGVHHCPGEAIAIELATAAVRFMHGEGVIKRAFRNCLSYRPLANARIPVF